MNPRFQTTVQPLLLTGDIISFLTFSALGRASHEEANGLGALGAVVGTAAPFLCAWMLVGIPIGAIAFKPETAMKQLLGRTALAWLLAWPVALLFRAVLLRRGIPFSFAIVALLTNGAFLLTWRSVAATFVLNVRRRA